MAKPMWVYLVGHIRKIWRWSPRRRECLKAAKGCVICGKRAVDLQADHKDPVGPAPKSPPWVGWDRYLERMFEGELQPVCVPCHKKKTKEENAERRKRRKKDAN